ncbi:hypothetical protein [Virgisporangium aurantiacum]|uniref:Secreted protein n=1 Tax=Virgisporangium aurantiacum TaxID=175570 RepID=A0A8J4E891_9ACTN|nr:hypothetical protein [Virgisporangium aurantiacum]GIJ65008.1 hypothetical protein Vau01_125240 [Virgisporangium aurantiacum]
MGAALAARHRFAVSLALAWLLASDDSAGLMTFRCAPIAALQCALPASSSSATMLGMTDEQRLAQMIDEIRRMRERCEPKSNQNPRYLRYSNAVSALRWIIDDLAKERALHPDR